MARLETRKEKRIFAEVRRAEKHYDVQLRRIARHVGDIVSGIAPRGIVTPEQQRRIDRALANYAELIKPWAETASASLLANVSRRDEQVWMDMTKNMSHALRDEIRRTPTGALLRSLQREQVSLIQSLPLKAALRVHEFTMKGLEGSLRADEVAAEIMNTTEVTESRATLIARTETGRAASNLTEARALNIGSEGYIWRTGRDGDVRPSHRRMEGKFVYWNKPPKTDKNLAPYHAGCGPNCRCYAEPVIPEIY